MDIGALAQHILDTHHALLRAELPKIDAALRAQRTPPDLMQPWSSLMALLDQHMMKEEVILFPNILAFARGEDTTGCGFAGPIAQMHEEHKHIRALEAEVRASLALAGEQADAIAAVLDDLAVHAGREDDELFPAVLAARGARPLSSDDDEPSPLAESVIQMCRGATDWHARFRLRLSVLEDRLDPLKLSPRFTAPWGHFTKSLREHIDEEERELFPALVAAAEGHPPADQGFRRHLNDMQTELFEVRTIADALRVAATEAGEHEADLLTLLDELEEHARRESEELWPAATALIDGRRQPLPPRSPPPRPAPPRRGLLRRAAHRIRGLISR